MSVPRSITAALLALLVANAGCVAPGAPANSPGWRASGPLAIPRDDFGLAPMNGRLWAIGGMTGARGNALNSAEVFDPGTSRWTPGPAMPTPRSSSGVAVDGSSIYVIGGLASGGVVTNTVESLDTTTGIWTQRAPLPAPRMQLAAVAVGGRVWAIGGNDANGPAFARVDVYDPATDHWTVAAPLETARYGLVAVLFEGNVYAIGGQSAQGALPTVEIAAPSGGRWRLGPALPTGLTRLGVAYLNGELHAIAGAEHFTLGVGAGTWRRAPAMPTSRHGLAAAALGGYLYTVGGCSDDLIDLGVNEIYAP